VEKISTYLTRRHHHATTDSVERIGSNTSTSSDAPTEQEGSQEVTLKRSNENNRLDGIVHSEVETTVDNDTSDRWEETTIQTSNTIGSQCLAVDINKTVELTFTTLLGRFGIVGETGTSIIKRIDEEQRGSTGSLKF
jgi:hypothetical protein